MNIDSPAPVYQPMATSMPPNYHNTIPSFNSSATNENEHIAPREAPNSLFDSLFGSEGNKGNVSSPQLSAPGSSSKQQQQQEQQQQQQPPSMDNLPPSYIETVQKQPQQPTSGSFQVSGGSNNYSPSNISPSSSSQGLQNAYPSYSNAQPSLQASSPQLHQQSRLQLQQQQQPSFNVSQLPTSSNLMMDSGYNSNNTSGTSQRDYFSESTQTYQQQQQLHQVPQQQQQQQQYYQQQQPHQAPPPPPQQQQQAVVDPVQKLLERYPNPQTENEKLKKDMESLTFKLQAHMKKMEDFAILVDRRLSTLEQNTKELQEKCNNKGGGGTFFDLEGDRSPVSRSSSGGSSGSKKKKKKRSMSAHETSRSVDDEELARKLQQQFDAEASVPPKGDKIAQSDEEYAKRLQAMYLKRDLGGSSKSRSHSKSKKGEHSATDKKKEAEAAKKEEPKPSLWSRLFGAGSDDEEDSDEGGDHKSSSKPKEKKEEPKRNTSSSSSAMVPSVGAHQPNMQPLPYNFYPNQPVMYPGMNPQYVPMNAPGLQYYYQPPPTQQQ